MAFCPKCGTGNPDGVTVCNMCGASLLEGEQSNQQPGNGNYQQPQYNDANGGAQYGAPQQNQQMYNAQPQYSQQNGSVPPYVQPQYMQNLDGVVPVKEWLLTMLISCIPIVGIVMMFVWAFGSDTKKSKSNYFKAALIWALICFAVSIVVTVIIAAAGFSLANYV